LAPREIYGEVTVPLTLWPDGDFSDPGITHWDNGTVTVPVKSSDSQYKFIGNHRSLLVTTAGGNLYAQSDDIVVEPGDQIFHAAVGSVEKTSAGTAYYGIVDRSHGDTPLYEATFDSYRDQIVRRVTQIPTGCRKIAVRIGATANGVTTVWKALPSHRMNAGTSEVQSWLKEQMNLLGFGPAKYFRSTGDDRYNASDRVWEQWTDENGHDFQLMPFVPASDFYTLQINRGGGLQAEDYWIHGYRRMSDTEAELDNETAESNIDEEMLMTAVECLVTSRLGPQYAAQYQQCVVQLANQRFARPVIQPKRELSTNFIGLRNR